MAKIDQKFVDGYIPLHIPNVKVKWAKVFKPDTAFGGNKWVVDLLMGDYPQLVKEMKAAGFNIRDKKKDGVVIDKDVLTLKREVITKSGPQEPPAVVGLDGKTPFTQELGNGTVCNIRGSARAWPINGKLVLACYLEAIQVVNHVPYKSSSFDDISGVGEVVPF